MRATGMPMSMSMAFPCRRASAGGKSLPSPAQQEAQMSHLPAVSEFMDRYVQTISPDSDIMEAVDFLLEKRVTGALVANSKGELVGILTEYDCLRLLTHGDQHAEAPRGKVKDFMTSNVQTIPPTMDIYYCAGLFMNVSFRRFPVVEERRIVGAITRFDLLRAVRRHLAPQPVDHSR
jgi:CBS domain-containing protein